MDFAPDYSIEVGENYNLCKAMRRMDCLQADSTTVANLEKVNSQGMPKSEDRRQPQCPAEKGARGPVDLCFARTEAERRQAIKDALEHLG